MNKLVEAIQSIRSRIESLRKHALKETPTRTILIDPLLEALGWDVRDPDEVQMEYPTVDGKSVDYALKINRKPVLLVEAKALDDPLNDVKAITQVVGYAANDGIVWCALTNGLKWKVYRSVEKCPAPDKLMFEVSLDPRESEGVAIGQLAQQMWRFSREEMAHGTLDALGEQTFTDGKLRKALDVMLRNPPRVLVNLLRRAVGDESLTAQKTREGLLRIGREIALASTSVAFATPITALAHPPSRRDRSKAARTAWKTRQSQERPEKYDESVHTGGKPKEVLELYRAVDRICVALAPGRIEKRVRAKSINYLVDADVFCSLHIRQGGLRVWLRLKYARLESAPSFARDVSNIGHWGVGDLELAVSSLAQLDETARLIRQSFEGATA
jgi:predicted transport protein